MTRLRFAWLAGLALLASGTVALPAMALSDAVSRQPGTFTAIDDGKLFSSGGLDKAKSAMNETGFHGGLSVTVETFDSVPANKKLPAGEDEKKKFFRDWAGERARGDHARGIFILVCRHPGYVEVIADEQTHKRGFTHDDETKLRDILQHGFRDAAKESDPAKQFEKRDAALVSAIGFVVADLKATSVGAAHAAEKPGKAGGGMLSGIGGWLCLGAVVLLCVWLVIGLIRAFTGGGGGGSGGGGGGGGFMTSLFGGLFGAMAGMWLYNSMFGGGGMFGGSDAYASDGSAGDTGDTGAGDFSGDAGSGGGWDDGGGGGFGGGGDWGGGGDGGGGGGDF